METILVSRATTIGLAERGQRSCLFPFCLCSRPFLLEVLLDMEDECYTGAQSGPNDYYKRSAEPDNGLMFMLVPGGRAAVVSMQIPDEPQASASPQISGTQETPNAVIVPLSPAASSNDGSATVTGASGAPADTTAQLPPSTSSVDEPATNIYPTDQSTTSSIPSETSTILAGASTDGALEAVTSSSLQSYLPTTVSSDDAVYSKPPIYVGIVLGTIAGVACVTALFAWWVRIRSHAKRRHLYGDADVPWASSENGDSGLEEARDMTQTRSNLESIGLGGREDLAQVEAWEPRGDRDVGEPRRSESYPNSSEPFAHSCRAAPAIPGQHDSILSFIQPFQNGPYPRARPLPFHIQSLDSSSSRSVDDHSTASSLGPLRVANLLPGDQSAATSRATTALGMNNRAYSLGTDDLEDILRSEGETPGSTSDQRSLSAYSWKGLNASEEINRGSAELCERPVAPPEPERWTTSLKSIFTVMASNLSIRGRSINKGEDTLTPIPSRRSIRASSSGDISPDGHKAAYPQSITERNPCTAMGADKNCGSLESETSKPLAGRKSTKTGQLRRDLLSRNAGWGERCPSPDTPSRASSVYSNTSASAAVDCQLDDIMISRTLSRNGTLKLMHKRQGSKSEENLSVMRPPVITRVSSTGCSVASSQLADKEDAAQRALVDRRRRARRHNDWA